MAIVDNNNQSVVDRDDAVSIGLKLPIVLDNGQLASTKTTLEAVKQNILNLCNTEVGERVMQPTLGVRLKRFLFEPFTEDTVLQVQDIILESVNYWLPFVNLNDIQVKMSDNESGDFRSAMEISINFSLKRDPETLEMIQVTVSG
jgi:phage baseplate assembly protein W|tara:strand:+ start:5971 stop:6405 length:435 start_codon:yes stop_codon:yes gene_type:complete